MKGFYSSFYAGFRVAFEFSLHVWSKLWYYFSFSFLLLFYYFWVQDSPIFLGISSYLLDDGQTDKIVHFALIFRLSVDVAAFANFAVGSFSGIFDGVLRALYFFMIEFAK